jgi:hypothetical protein
MEKPDARRHKLSGIVGRHVYFELVHVQLNDAPSHVSDGSCRKYGSLQLAVGVSRELPVASEFILNKLFTFARNSTTAVRNLIFFSWH